MQIMNAYKINFLANGDEMFVNKIWANTEDDAVMCFNTHFINFDLIVTSVELSVVQFVVMSFNYN